MVRQNYISKNFYFSGMILLVSVILFFNSGCSDIIGKGNGIYPLSDSSSGYDDLEPYGFDKLYTDLDENDMYDYFFDHNEYIYGYPLSDYYSDDTYLISAEKTPCQKSDFCTNCVTSDTKNGKCCDGLCATIKNLQWPVMTSNNLPRSTEITDIGSFGLKPPGRDRQHDGVDIRCSPNDKIVALTCGTVRDKGNSPAKGNSPNFGHYIIIEDCFGNCQLYGHLNAASTLSIGSKVKPGDVIGVCGESGIPNKYRLSERMHVHIEIAEPVEKGKTCKYVSLQGSKERDPSKFSKDYVNKRYTGYVLKDLTRLLENAGYAPKVLPPAR